MICFLIQKDNAQYLGLSHRPPIAERNESITIKYHM